MTLREILTAYPDLFYQGNDIWWKAEPFLDRKARHVGPFVASSVEPELRGTYYAADLALAYTEDPESSLWRRFLWVDDTDRWGNRCYVGGVGLYGIDAFQLHRRLVPECYWPRIA